MPNNLGLAQLTAVSLARTVALLLALLFWVASGRLDSWGSSRIVLGLMMIFGVTALSAGCFFIQMARDDGVPAPMPMVYRAAAGLLPLCFMAGALLPSRKLFLTVVVLAPLAGIVVASTWDSLHAKYIASLPKSKEQIESDALVARRTLELDRVPTTAGAEMLLSFVAPGEPIDVMGRALDRIETGPDWIDKLSGMLDGPRRLHALYALSRRGGLMPEAMVERCWNIAAAIAHDQSEQLKKGVPVAETETQTLLDSVEGFGSRSVAGRQGHVKEMTAVRDFVVAANLPLNTSQLYSWVRQAELNSIPQAAEILPLLAYTAPSEMWSFRQQALERIAKLPDSTTKLAKLLDSPHRLDALVVLAERAGEFPEELLETCWRAVGLKAKEMAKAIKQGTPPTRIDVPKLSSSTGSFGVKFRSVEERRRAELATVREVVQAVVDGTEKAAFLWSDKALGLGE